METCYIIGRLTLSFHVRSCFQSLWYTPCGRLETASLMWEDWKGLLVRSWKQLHWLKWCLWIWPIIYSALNDKSLAPQNNSLLQMTCQITDATYMHWLKWLGWKDGTLLGNESFLYLQWAYVAKMFKNLMQHANSNHFLLNHLVPIISFAMSRCIPRKKSFENDQKIYCQFRRYTKKLFSVLDQC